MKRYIVVMIDPEDMSTLTIQTDEISDTVRSISAIGYDIAETVDDDGVITEESLITIVGCLVETGKWAGEDGSRSLVLIDTQNIDCDTIAK